MIYTDLQPPTPKILQKVNLTCNPGRIQILFWILSSLIHFRERFFNRNLSQKCKTAKNHRVLQGSWGRPRQFEEKLRRQGENLWKRHKDLPASGRYALEHDQNKIFEYSRIFNNFAKKKFRQICEWYNIVFFKCVVLIPF